MEGTRKRAGQRTWASSSSKLMKGDRRRLRDFRLPTSQRVRIGSSKSVMNLRLMQVALAAFSALLSGCAATGWSSAIVTGTQRAPVPPESVRLYLQAPAAFEVIGLVKASSNTGWTEQGRVDYTIQGLKTRAGKMGANGVLLLSSGTRDMGTMAAGASGGFIALPRVAEIAEGQTIFVTSE